MAYANQRGESVLISSALGTLTACFSLRIGVGIGVVVEVNSATPHPAPAAASASALPVDQGNAVIGPAAASAPLIGTGAASSSCSNSLARGASHSNTLPEPVGISTSPIPAHRGTGRSRSDGLSNVGHPSGSVLPLLVLVQSVGNACNVTRIHHERRICIL